ncbi:hypothetical protein B0O80DRAFT_486348 [Mortierella sp. GBAus27b]|nr:hypothetical protein BGX31_010546 [Mortierella sp. GBA43]KAI8355797.1 hypothetical protein B0O80DRAFT_486348 [Mortierella sp. GBAus27b]
MLVTPAAQSHFKADAFATRQSPKSYHRRAVSCLAVASHHEHYNHPSYYMYDMIEVAEGSASPIRQTRHTKRKSEGAISLEQLQKGLSGAGVANSDASTSEANGKNEGVTASGSLNGKLVKLNVVSPTNTPRRSLLSDLLNNQGTPSRQEQAAQRRRMLKSMRRYSVDVHEMDFNVGRPSTRVTPMEGIPSEEEPPMLVNGRQGFSTTPTVRYLRNPCHAAVKTKLLPSTYRSTPRRGKDGEDESADYFGVEDRVW